MSKWVVGGFYFVGDRRSTKGITSVVRCTIIRNNAGEYFNINSKNVGVYTYKGYDYEIATEEDIFKWYVGQVCYK